MKFVNNFSKLVLSYNISYDKLGASMIDNKDIKMLKKAYTKRFKCISSSFFSDKEAGLTLFIEYLKYIRDSMIINNYENSNKQTNIATIIAAIAEFDAYKSSKDSDIKVFHWNSFTELLKQNMEEWLQLDDSV
jgi:hypothetical protein